MGWAAIVGFDQAPASSNNKRSDPILSCPTADVEIQVTPDILWSMSQTTPAFFLRLFVLVLSFAFAPDGAKAAGSSSRDVALVVPKLKTLPPGATFSDAAAILGDFDEESRQSAGVFLYQLSEESDLAVVAPDRKEIWAIFHEHADKLDMLIDRRPTIDAPAIIAALSDLHMQPQRRVARLLETAMKQASEMTLYSIAPDSRYDVRESGMKVITLTGWEGSAWTITGEKTLRAQTDIAALASSLRENVEQANSGPASCFRPRHALRFQRNGETITLLVCFECLQCDIDGFKEAGTRPWLTLSFSPTAVRTWNEIFTRAGLTIQRDTPPAPTK
jgi:hypothetical protein